MGLSTGETGAGRKAVIIEVSRLALGLMAAGVAALIAVVWNTPSDFAKRDAELSIIKERQERASEAIKDIPALKQEVGIIKYRVDELKVGQDEQLRKLDTILRNQRTDEGRQ